MKKSFLSLALGLGLAAVVAAQQLELNSAGGSLTRAGVNPTPGQPFTLNTTAVMNFNVGGIANNPYILLFGSIAPVSNNFGGIFNGQYLDLEQASVIVVGDGSGLFPTSLPSSLFILNSAGAAAWNVPVNTQLDGVQIGWQALCFDPSQAFNQNFTAAIEFDITSDLIWSGDDIAQNYNFPSGAYTIYGTSFASCQPGTNGYVKFGGTVTSDFTESLAEFQAGNPNGTTAGPLAAIMWEDLNMIAPAGLCRISENVATRTTTIRWENGQYFGGAPAGVWGTIIMTIQENSGSPIFTYDYTGFTHAVPPSEGIVGLSAGNGTAVSQHDMATAGTINPYASAVTPDSVGQSFDGLAPSTLAAQPFDLAGTIMTIIETGGGVILF